jgi:hypothetical protein
MKNNLEIIIDHLEKIGIKQYELNFSSARIPYQTLSIFFMVAAPFFNT